MRRVKILTNGYIMPITMDGPIVSPIAIDDRTVFNLVRRGYNVVEVDTANAKSVKLTIDNFNDPNRFGETVPVQPIFTTTGAAIDGEATPVIPVSDNMPIAPTPAAINQINESKTLSRAERKAKRREEEAKKKAAAEEAKKKEAEAAVEVAAEPENVVETTEPAAETVETAPMAEEAPSEE